MDKDSKKFLFDLLSSIFPSYIVHGKVPFCDQLTYTPTEVHVLTASCHLRKTVNLCFESVVCSRLGYVRCFFV